MSLIAFEYPYIVLFHPERVLLLQLSALEHYENLTYYTVSRNLNPINTGDFRGIAIAPLHSLGKRVGKLCGQPFGAAGGRSFPLRTL